MKQYTPSSQGGFSLIEIFVVLVIIGIVTTFALLTFASSKVDLHRQAIAREFKIYLERARFDSVKRRADDPNRATVTLESATRFTVHLDLDDDGVLQPNEIRTVDFTQRGNTLILVTDTLVYPVKISFDRRGHATTVDDDGVEIPPVFTICSNCNDASPDKSVISLSATGTVAITADETDPSTLPTPSVTNADVTPNCYIFIPDPDAVTTTTCPLQ